MNLFMASMILLVMGDSLPLTFVGWEGVGLCSYLLIGFWHRTDAFNDAARKAFVYNRVGDLGFLLGAFALFQLTGHLDYDGIAAWFRAQQDLTGDARLWAAGGCLLLFLGCCGKSAQIPLAAWLPDAMAGPTPVSALIHAATMVTAGVYLVARTGDAFAHVPEVLAVVLAVGCLTAVWGAVAGLFQQDIKKALAYSTVSQLGFMFCAAGVGAYDVALFHVFTHAFFKATLFLGAGSVIHALHHEQDLRRMGGVHNLPGMKWAVFTPMFFALWAITGLPFAAGFWSKDLILEHVFAGHAVLGGVSIATVVGIVLVATAGLTALYMTRMMMLAFWSPSRVDPAVAAHPHAVPLTMTIPVWILGLGSLAAGFVWIGLPVYGFPDGAFAHFQHWLAPVVGPAQQVAAGTGHGGGHGLAWAIAGVGTLVAAVGCFAAWSIWRKGPAGAVPAAGSDTAPAGFGGGWTFAPDHVARWILVKPVTGLAYGIYWVVELATFGGLGWLTAALARGLGDGYAFALQRSRLRSGIALGVAGLLAALLFLLLTHPA
jgi:NADH-quinone oxidoreductase subunit L